MEIIWRNTSSAEVYEEARVGKVFNLRRPDRFPTAVVRPKTEGEIVEAVSLASKLGTRVAVLSGGHSFAAWSVRNNSILIDLSNYHEVEIDTEKLIARVSPSTKGSKLDATLINDYGLLFGAGHCPSVAVGGFLLLGGMGWNSKNWGWACERVKAIDVVTADGRLLHCNRELNSDLFWLARGAGPGFPGVVTRFHLQLRQAPKVFRCSTYIYPGTLYRRAFAWVLNLAPTFHHGTEVAAVFRYFPGINEPCLFISFVTMADTLEEAQAALLPAQQTRPQGTIQEDFCIEDSLAQEYRNQETAYPGNRRYYTDNAFLRNEVDVPAVLEEAFQTLPDPKHAVLWSSMNPCSRRKLPDMALSMQSDHYVAIYTFSEDEKDDNACMSWVDNIMKKVERFSEGAYMGDSDFQFRRSKFWGDSQGKKLMELRRKWDPTGRICGFLDVDDESGLDGLPNEHEWKL